MRGARKEASDEGISEGMVEYEESMDEYEEFVDERGTTRIYKPKPVWSTSEECKELAKSLGKDKEKYIPRGTPGVVFMEKVKE